MYSRRGEYFLSRSASGNKISKYHLEAAGRGDRGHGVSLRHIERLGLVAFRLWLLPGRRRWSWCFCEAGVGVFAASSISVAVA